MADSLTGEPGADTDPSQGRSGWNGPGALRPVLAAVLLALAVRALLIGYYAWDTGLPVASVVDGHDGSEYIRFAQALGSGAVAEIPPDARRHDPGLPLYLIPWVKLPWVNVAAYAGSLLPLLAGLFFFWRLLALVPGLDSRQAGWMVAALPLVYPSQLYFSLFVMTEPLFIGLMLLAVLLFLKERRLAAYLAVGLTAIVRGPGVFLVPALLGADLLARRGETGFWGRVWPCVAAGVPPLIWVIVTQVLWGSSHVEILSPVFGLPFSGLGGILALGWPRAIYVTATVVFFLVSTGLLLREAARAGWRSPFLTLGSIFCVLMLLFHLSLKTMFNMHRHFDMAVYLDRYFVVLLPFALYPWRGALKPWVIAAATVASVTLSAWWGHNYFIARGLP